MLFFKPINLLTIFFLLSSLLSAQNIRYKADNVKILQKEKIVILTGNAFIQKGKNQGLRADRILWNQNTKIAEAFENINFLNRQQGVLYKGGYLKFFIDQDQVIARENPSIEKKKNNLVMFAKEFWGDTRKNIIRGSEDVLVNIEKKEKAKKIIMNGDNSVYDLDKNLFRLNGNVKISQELQKVGKEEKEKKLNINDFDVYCEKATFIDEEELLQCEVDARAENKVDKSILYGDKIIFNSLSEELNVDKNVRYLKTENNITEEAFSDKLSMVDADKQLVMTGNVRIFQKEGQKTVNTMSCREMHYFFLDDKETVECFDNVEIFSVKRNLRAKSGYFFFDVKQDIGFMNKYPFLIREEEENNNFIYSDKIDFDDNQKKIFYRENVLIEQVSLKENKPVNQTRCVEGILDYQNEEKEIFYCNQNVAVKNLENDMNFFGDNLTTYFDTDYTLLENNVSFNQIRSETNYISGKSKYIESFSNNKNIFFKEDVVVNEFVNDKKVNLMQANEAKFDYSQDFNTLESYGDVFIENLEEDSEIFSDYFFYNQSLDFSYVLGEPFLIDKNQGSAEDNIIYADKIELYSNKKVSKLYTNIVMFSSANYKNDYPARDADQEINNLNEYITCEEGFYDYSVQGQEKFNCITQFNYFDKSGNINLSSEFADYDINNEYAEVKGNPLLTRTEVTNTYYTYSETMNFDFLEKEIFLNTNVLMVRLDNFSEMTNGTVSCNNSRYSYAGEESLECFNEVVVLDLENQTRTTSDYMKFFITNEYVYMSENPEFFSDRDGEKTYVKGDVFERFEKEKIMYAKGNVFVDNGVNEGTSSLGIYDIENDLFILYSQPSIRDKKGSEFRSEEVTFDLKTGKLVLDNDVIGGLQLE